jgi:hypothetical protein
MAAASSATEKTKSGVTSLWGKVVGGGEKKMEVGEGETSATGPSCSDDDEVVETHDGRVQGVEGDLFYIS